MEKQKNVKMCVHPFPTKQTWSTHFPTTFKYFLISLCHVKYFGKCFGPSTRAPKFLTYALAFYNQKWLHN